VYNNVVIAAGLGPEWSDGSSAHAGIRIAAGVDARPGSRLSVYSNTVYGCGFASSETHESGNLYIESPVNTAVSLLNNVFSSTGEPNVVPSFTPLPPAGYANLFFAGGGAQSWDVGALVSDPCW
jgi:hypothetical protein